MKEIWIGVRHIACRGDRKSEYKTVCENLKTLGRKECRWEDNIKMDLRRNGYTG
jgi:hypothetical protein